MSYTADDMFKTELTMLREVVADLAQELPAESRDRFLNRLQGRIQEHMSKIEATTQRRPAFQANVPRYMSMDPPREYVVAEANHWLELLRNLKQAVER